MKGKNKDSIITQHQFEREEKARLRIEDFFKTGQMSSEVAMFTLHLLGFSANRAKEIVKQWKDGKCE